MELSTTCDKELQEHEEKLDQVLKSWKFPKSSAPKDGNCLLYSIIHDMKYQVNNGNMILGKFLQQCCGIDIKNDHYHIEKYEYKGIYDWQPTTRTSQRFSP